MLCCDDLERVSESVGIGKVCSSVPSTFCMWPQLGKFDDRKPGRAHRSHLMVPYIARVACSISIDDQLFVTADSVDESSSKSRNLPE